MGPNWGQQQQQRMRQQQQQQQRMKRQQEQMQRQQQQMREQMERMREQQKKAAWLEQQQQNKQNQQAGQINVPTNKVTGNMPPVQLKSDWNRMPTSGEVKKKRGGCTKVINTIVGMAFFGFVIYVVLLILENM
jgi:uncharacterized protein HemX